MLERIAYLCGAAFVIALCAMVMAVSLDNKFPSQMPELIVADAGQSVMQIDVSASPQATSERKPTTQLSLSMTDAAPVEDVLRDRLAQIAAANPRDVRDVPATYYATWTDLIARCWASVSGNQPFDETGLQTVGQERLDYTQYSTQKWQTADRIFTVTYRIESAYGTKTGVDRTCSIKTWRQPFSTQAVQELKAHYDTWFASERLDASTFFRPYRWDLRDGDQFHGAETVFGSAQGCPMYMQYRDIVFASDTEATFFLTELTDEDCTAPSGAATAGVKVNRLPQVNK